MKTSHGLSHSTCRYLISHKKREKHGGGDDKRETIHLLLNFISVKEFFAFAQGRIFHLAYFNYIFLNHAIPSLFVFFLGVLEILTFMSRNRKHVN